MSRTSAHAVVLSLFFAGVALTLSIRFGPVWYLEPASRIPGDFHVYWVAAERLSAGQVLYQPTDSSPFKYSPTFAYLLRGSFFLLEQKLAAALWMAMSVLAYFGALIALGRRLVVRASNPGQLVSAVIVATAFSWHGLLETLSYGQIDLVLGALLVLISPGPIGHSAHRSRPGQILRALLWAGVLMVKPPLALVLIPACLAMGWREGMRAAIATAVVLLIPALWLGPGALAELFGQWWTCLSVQQDAAFMTSNINQSFAAVLARLMVRQEEFGALSVLGVATYGALTLLLGLRLRPLSGRSPEVRLGLLAFGLCGYLVFSPLSWRWGVFLWIPVVAIAAVLQRLPWKLLPWLAIAFVSTGLVASWIGLGVNNQVSFLGLLCWASLSLLWPLLDALFKDVQPAGPAR